MWLFVWIKTLDFLKKCWEGIKKLPKWAFFAGLLLLSLCWYLFRRVLLERKRTALVKKMSDLEIKKTKDLTIAREVHEEAGNKIIEKFAADRSEIEVKEKELDKEIAKGPVAIANAWKNFLAEGK